jgi:hypothetical protein
MTRSARLLGLLLALLAACAAGPARANSVFSIGGLGEPQLEEAARLRALGGAGAAEHGPRAFSLVNPATMADAERLIFEGTIMPAVRRVSAADFPTETGAETTVPSLRLTVMLPGRVVLGVAYLTATNAQFRVDRLDTAGVPSALSIEGTGGMSLGRISLARRVTPVFSLGVDCDILAGGYREIWYRTFPDSALFSSRDTLEVDYANRARFRIGGLFSRQKFSLGAAVELEQSLPMTTTQRSAGPAVHADRGDLTIPPGLAVGVSVPLGWRERAVAQYRRAGWSRSSLESNLVDFRAQERYSVGLERQYPPPGENLRGFAAMPLRVGGYFLRWPDLLPPAGAADISGGTASVDEWAVTFGTGIRSADRGGSLDVSFELGSRGSLGTLGAREQFVRLAFSLQVSDETWKGSRH